MLATTVSAPGSSATKYKPCTLLTTTDLDGALNAKVTKSQGEYEAPPDNEGPLKGEVVDGCSWILGSGAIGVVLRIIRAVASVPEMAEFLFAPIDETARTDGATAKTVKLGGTECRLYGHTKVGPSSIPPTVSPREKGMPSP